MSRQILSAIFKSDLAGKKIIFVYSDASFSNVHNLAVIGVLIFSSQSEHDANDVDAAILKTEVINVDGNVRAELMAILWAFELVSEQAARSEKPKDEISSAIQLFTDCKTATSLPRRRHKLEARDFRSQKTGTSLKNADVYRKFYALIDLMPVQLNWIKGHAPQHGKSLYQQNFSYIDRHVRKTLRDSISSR
jgi:ribonuclease HI